MSAGAKFLAQTLGLCAGVLLLGYFPTVRLAGTGAVPGMFAGVGVSLVGSWIGALPIALSRGGESNPGTNTRVLASVLLRFAVVVGSALSIVLSGRVDRAAFLIWVALAYLVLLVADTHYALQAQSAKRRS
ncbi:MAG: hypothetical protein Q7R41_14400 [Phycisphaerales bacterium]|nr:hypothetical protein [Phycisphaerales bacterium]